jgi:hypothetical protein
VGAIWDSHHASLVDIACELETHAALGADERHGADAPAPSAASHVPCTAKPEAEAAGEEEKIPATPVNGGRDAEKHETARELLDRVHEWESAALDRALGLCEPNAHPQQGIAPEEDLHLRAVALYNRLSAAGYSIRPVPDNFPYLRSWLREAVKIQKTPMELFEEMQELPRSLLAEKYGEIEALGLDEPPDLDSLEAMSDPDRIPREGLVFAYRQEAIAMRVWYMARGFDLPPVPDGFLNILQWLLDADKIVTARQDNRDRVEDGTAESRTASASKQAGFRSEANPYCCPSWDSVVTTQEIKRIEREFGTLAGTLADLASMIRDMDHVAPREIDLAHRAKVVVKPTTGVRELADEAEMAEDAAIDAMTGDSLESSDPSLVEWQSCETVGFLIRILASARMLRPKIEMVIGDGQARGCYVNLHRTLTYRDHTALLPKTGGGPVLRWCMQWKGVDGSAERLAACIDDWHRNLMLLVTGDEPKSQAVRDTTPSLCEFSRQAKASEPLVAKQDKATPKNDPKLIYQADAATFYNIPKSVLSKAAERKPGEPGYLWSDREGRRIWYRRSDLEKISRSREKLRGS